MNVLIPIIFFVTEFLLITLSFKFVLTKKPHVLGDAIEKKDKTVAENASQDQYKNGGIAVTDVIQNTDNEKTTFSKILDLFLNKEHSWLISAILFALLAIIAGIAVNVFSVSLINAVKIFVAYSGLSVFFLTDAKFYIIPNKILIIMIAVRLLLLPMEYLVDSENFVNILIDCAIGAVGCFVILAIISLLSKGGIGMGDVKLFTTLGLVTGLYCTFNTLLYGLVICALFSLLLMVSKRKKAKDKVPFAPFIFVGFLVTLILGSF
ncbi:MAG: A24 family peptidase [Ruminococcus sp.]|nr:A24 family peptidase [Ruminococcus sp.]